MSWISEVGVGDGVGGAFFGRGLTGVRRRSRDSYQALGEAARGVAGSFRAHGAV